MSTKGRVVEAAAVQAEPIWFNWLATIDKTCKLIEEAAKNGAGIVAFPEVFVPGYPTWIWARAIDFDMSINYTKNSLAVDSDEMKQIQASAAENNIVVCFGFSELRGNSTYMAQCTIDSDGKILMTRQKLKPFHLECTVLRRRWSKPQQPRIYIRWQSRAVILWRKLVLKDISECDRKLTSSQEHFKPLLNFSTNSQGEEIHIGAWPPVTPHPGGLAPYSMSDAAVSLISQVEKFGTQLSLVFNAPGGGNARIFGPDGRQMTEDLPSTKEGMVYADLDMDLIVKEKGILDKFGHNSRSELVWLGRNSADQRVVRNG